MFIIKINNNCYVSKVSRDSFSSYMEVSNLKEKAKPYNTKEEAQKDLDYLKECSKDNVSMRGNLSLVKIIEQN